MDVATLVKLVFHASMIWMQISVLKQSLWLKLPSDFGFIVRKQSQNNLSSRNTDAKL